MNQEICQQLSNKFIGFFRDKYPKVEKIEPKDHVEIESFLRYFASIFVDERFVIPENERHLFIFISFVISNLFAFSRFKNTDICIKKILNNKTVQELSDNDFIKLLTLLSARNSIEINYTELFKKDNFYASMWFFTYFKIADPITELTFKNLKKHLKNIDEIDEMLVLTTPSNNYDLPRIFNNFNLYESYTTFFSTFIDSENDKKLKIKLNNLIKERLKDINIKNNPNKKKIAVISYNYQSTHSVFRGISRYVESLSNDYDLTLITLKKVEDKVNIFNEIIYLDLSEPDSISKISENDFSLAYFADTCLNPESFILSNLRIAPVQIAGLGHSLSSCSTEIDYFITGTEIENQESQKNYTEKLIFIKGVGLYPTYPDYIRVPRRKPERNYISVICSWSYQKINYNHLIVLKRILEKVSKRVKFTFFVNSYGNVSSFLYKNEIEEVLGMENVVVLSDTGYQKYMSIIADSDFSIESYHFGGYNTTIDSIYVGKPVIAYKGDRAFNSFSAALLKKSGWEELITNNDQEYINKIVELINNDNYRIEIQDRFLKTDFDSLIFNTGEEQYFKKAIDFLVNNQSINHKNIES